MSTLVTEAFLQHSPDWSIDWSDSSSANRYGPFIVLWDSHDNILVYDVPDTSNDAALQAELDDLSAEDWTWWDHEMQLVNEPDEPSDLETFEYILRTLNNPPTTVAEETDLFIVDL